MALLIVLSLLSMAFLLEAPTACSDICLVTYELVTSAFAWVDRAVIKGSGLDTCQEDVATAVLVRFKLGEPVFNVEFNPATVALTWNLADEIQ